MASSVSSISQALSRNVDAVNIPKPKSVASEVAPKASTAKEAAGPSLPTPPNSISPSLPAHGLSARARNEGIGSPPIDSDIDLQDAVDYANNQGQLQVGSPPSGTDSSGSDGFGIITPAFLAKHHLPGIVLNNGPMAIRHVMNQLSNTVPGFADVPPAKARRIVVAGLESRQGGGLDGNVEFEKVGWGRWDAKLRGHARSNPVSQPLRKGQLSPPASALLRPQSSAVKIPGGGIARRKPRQASHGSWYTETPRAGPIDVPDVDMLDQDVERMSLDGDDGQSATRKSCHDKSSYDSETDESDWASIGAAGLRASSQPKGGGIRMHPASNPRRSHPRSPYALFPKSMSPSQTFHAHCQNKTRGIEAERFNVDAGPEEREAAEALLRLGSL